MLAGTTDRLLDLGNVLVTLQAFEMAALALGKKLKIDLTKERTEGGRVVIDRGDKKVVKKTGYAVWTDDEL